MTTRIRHLALVLTATVALAGSCLGDVNAPASGPRCQLSCAPAPQRPAGPAGAPCTPTDQNTVPNPSGRICVTGQWVQQ